MIEEGHEDTAQVEEGLRDLAVLLCDIFAEARSRDAEALRWSIHAHCTGEYE